MEFRNLEVINSVGTFTLVVLLLFSFAFDPNTDSGALAGGLLWVIYAFASILILNRSFGREMANDCLTGLTAAPAGGSAVFMGKTIANVVLLLSLELMSLPVFVVFYDVRIAGSYAWMGAVLVLGAWALSATGALFGAITAKSGLRELMLPVIVFPLVLPALIACVHLTMLLFAGEPLADSMVWIRLLIVFNVIFTLLGATLTDFVLTA